MQLQRLWVVNCVSKGRLEDVDAFFCRHSKRLRVGDALAPDLDWTPWLSLRYIAVRGAVRWGLVAVANTPGSKSTEDRRSGESVRTRTRRTHATRCCTPAHTLPHLLRDRTPPRECVCMWVGAL